MRQNIQNPLSVYKSAPASHPSQKSFVFPSGSEHQRAAAWGRKGGGTGGGNCDLRSDSECLGQKMAKIQDCEGASRPGTKQAWRGSLQSSPEFGCGACILVIFCPSHSHRGAWSCFLLLSRLPSSPMLLSAYFRQHLPQENNDFHKKPKRTRQLTGPLIL